MRPEFAGAKAFTAKKVINTITVFSQIDTSFLRPPPRVGCREKEQLVA